MASANIIVTTAGKWCSFVLEQSLRARFPSIFCLIAIELNVPRDEISSIAIELTFVTLESGGSVLFDIGDAWDKFFFFFNPITSFYR